jgi:hypothetical protein
MFKGFQYQKKKKKKKKRATNNKELAQTARMPDSILMAISVYHGRLRVYSHTHLKHTTNENCEVFIKIYIEWQYLMNAPTYSDHYNLFNIVYVVQ